MIMSNSPEYHLLTDAFIGGLLICEKKFFPLQNLRKNLMDFIAKREYHWNLSIENIGFPFLYVNIKNLWKTLPLVSYFIVIMNQIFASPDIMGTMGSIRTL